MKIIKWYLNIGWANAMQEGEFEFDDNATDEEIEETIKDIVFGYIDWGWEECLDGECH